MLLWSELSLKIAWGSNIMNSYDYSPREVKLINLRHNLVSALGGKLSRKQRQAVDDELFLLLEKF